MKKYPTPDDDDTVARIFLCPLPLQPIRWHSKQIKVEARKLMTEKLRQFDWKQQTQYLISAPAGATTQQDPWTSSPTFGIKRKQGKSKFQHPKHGRYVSAIFGHRWRHQRPFYQPKECNVILWLDQCLSRFSLFLLIPAVRTTTDASTLLTEKVVSTLGFSLFQSVCLLLECFPINRGTRMEICHSNVFHGWMATIAPLQTTHLLHFPCDWRCFFYLLKCFHSDVLVFVQPFNMFRRWVVCSKDGAEDTFNRTSPTWLNSNLHHSLKQLTLSRLSSFKNASRSFNWWTRRKSWPLRTQLDT